MHPILIGLVSTLCFPVYVVVGLYTRARSMRLSPARGPRSGQHGEGEPATRLLTIGDSSAAAVGIDKTSGAMGPQLAGLLKVKTGEAVYWHISGHNSAVSSEVRDYIVPNLPPEDFTHILIMLGTNDMKNWHTVRRFKRDFGGLLYALRARFPEARIYWPQAMDMVWVPALPKVLAHILNWRRQLLNRKGAQLCVERGVICIPPLEVENQSGFCRDGFHASEIGYAAWAQHILAHWDYEPRTTPAAQPFL